MQTVSKESKIMEEIYGRVYEYGINRLTMRMKLTGFISLLGVGSYLWFRGPSSSLPAVRQDDSTSNRAVYYRK